MKIVKYNEFIKEDLIHDTPETYVEIALKQLKKKIDKMFEYQEDDIDDNEQEKSIQKARLDSKNKSKISFKDLGVRLESSEISKYSKLYDNVTFKFVDDEAWYNLFLAIDIKEAIPKDKEKDFSSDDIEMCYIKFKKYDLDTNELIGQISKNIKIKDINEELIIDLKIELDDKFGDDEEFKIETE
jgi:hypothetical protein